MSDDWDRCRKFLAPAIHEETGGRTMEDYAIGVKAGYFQLWPAANSAALTGTSYLPDGGECVNVLLIGGDLEEAQELLDQIEAVARRGGAVAVQAVARVGWRKEARSRGWDHIASIFYKKLEH